MRSARGAGILSLLLLASCAGVKAPAPVAPAPAVAPQAAAEPASPVPPTAPVPSREAAPEVTPPASSPAPADAQPSVGQGVAKAAPPSAKTPAKTPAPAAQPPKTESAAPDVAKPKAPPLDLDSLKERLKDTKAIGVLTKITLKNQVDDLLDQFRAYYQGKLKVTLAELRRSFDLLVQKVLSLLQDSDQQLAMAIVASRDAIWGILSDPKKFATI
jgi:hypothetical protein